MLKMIIKGLITEDFVNYKKPSLTIMMPRCSFKCDKESGCDLCQNSHLVNEPDIVIEDVEEFIDKYYIQNDITESVVFQGLEPFDTFDDLYRFIQIFRSKSDDDIVIYSGYNKDEIQEYINLLHGFKNIIIKLGRYIPNRSARYSTHLGVQLSSDNQYSINLNEEM